jgi:hypothetical protein
VPSFSSCLGHLHKNDWLKTGEKAALLKPDPPVKEWRFAKLEM